MADRLLLRGCPSPARALSCRAQPRRSLLSITCQAHRTTSNGEGPSASGLPHQPAQQLSGRQASTVYGSIAREVSKGQPSSTELELFGLGHEELKVLTHRIQGAKRWSHFQESLNTALRASLRPGLDPSCLTALITAALTTAPKVLRRQYGAAGAQVEAESAEVVEAVQEMLDYLRPRLHQLDAKSIVAVAVALAKLAWPDEALMLEVADATTRHLSQGQVSAQGLSLLIWALGTAGVRPRSAWLSTYYNQVESRLGNMDPQSLANVFWALCRLDIMPPWVSGDWAPATIYPHMQRVAATQAGGHDPATLLVCLAIWCRHYSWRLSDAQLSALLCAMQRGLPAWAPEDLVSAVHSVVVLNHEPHAAWMRTLHAAVRARLSHEPLLELSDLQRLLWALSRISTQPSRAWLQAFVEVSADKLALLKVRALSELIWALACWGYTPTQEWLKEYFATTQPKLREYKPCHLANSMLALKKLGCKIPTSWLDAALASFCAQLREAKAHDLVAFIDGVVDVCEDPAFFTPSVGQRLRALADFAASKYDVVDCVMHAKLLVALVTAKCVPGPEGAAQPEGAPAEPATPGSLSKLA